MDRYAQVTLSSATTFNVEKGIFSLTGFMEALSNLKVGKNIQRVLPLFVGPLPVGFESLSMVLRKGD